MEKLEPPVTARAWCYRSGELEFGLDAPEGVIVVAEVRGPTAEHLRRTLEPLSRLAYNGRTLLVPGVPEAVDGRVAVEALNAWLERVRPALNKARTREGSMVQ